MNQVDHDYLLLLKIEMKQKLNDLLVDVSTELGIVSDGISIF
jgi:hypothetical protein